MKITSIEFSGSTFGPRGDAQVTIRMAFNKMDNADLQKYAKAFREAHYRYRTKYEALKHQGITLNCHTLQYVPKHSGDATTFKFRTIAELVKVAEEWEEDVAQQMGIVKSKALFEERCDKYHLLAGIDQDYDSDAIKGVSLTINEGEVWSCGGAHSTYLDVRPWWMNHRGWSSRSCVKAPTIVLEDITDEFLAEAEKELAEKFNQVMYRNEGWQVAEERLKSIADAYNTYYKLREEVQKHFISSTNTGRMLLEQALSHTAEDWAVTLMGVERGQFRLQIMEEIHKAQEVEAERKRQEAAERKAEKLARAALLEQWEQLKKEAEGVVHPRKTS